jgi:hypothetical protein
LCLKSRGFRFEETHLKDPERLSTLLGILSVAFSWAHKIGEWQHEEQPIKIKKHGRKEKSFFRVGLDMIRTTLIGIANKMLDFLELFIPIKLLLKIDKTNNLCCEI